MTYRYTLMIPGPVDVADDVLQEMGSPLVAHYGPRWAEVYWETVDLLKKILQTNGDVYILVGTGTAGLDAGIGGILNSGEKVLVLNNGWFAERMIQIANSYNLKVNKLDFDILSPLSIEPIESYLREEIDCRAILMVHHETHTGIVNPVKAVGQLAKQHGALLILDAISSAGGIELKVDDWGVDFCVTASQKGLEAPPGLALISISDRAWEVIDSKGPTGHGFYLDPRVWREYRQNWGDWHPTHTTMTSNNILALRASLLKIIEEGLENRFKRYQRVSKTIRNGLQNLNFEMLIDESIASPVVTTVKTPSGIQSTRIRDYLRDQHGILISLGPPAYRDETIRVGHMGEETELDHILPFFISLEDTLREFGLDIPRGISLAGLDVYWNG